MNKRRLLKLAEFLETAELPGKFRMGLWGEEVKGDGRPACGSAACAAGWATTIPSFRRAGLRLHVDRGTIFVDAGGTGSVDGAIGRLAAFFGFDTDAAGEIFWPGDMHNLNGKHGRRIIARRIRKLVASAP